MAIPINYIRILNIQVEIPGDPTGQTTPITPPGGEEVILMEDSGNVLQEDSSNILIE